MGFYSCLSSKVNRCVCSRRSVSFMPRAFFFSQIQLFFKVDKMLSCVHCKCANQLFPAVGCASSVMEMWIFSVASGSRARVSHPKHLNNIISSLTYAYGLMRHKIWHFHFYFMHLCPFEILQHFQRVGAFPCAFIPLSLLCQYKILLRDSVRGHGCTSAEVTRSRNTVIYSRL